MKSPAVFPAGPFVVRIYKGCVAFSPWIKPFCQAERTRYVTIFFSSALENLLKMVSLSERRGYRDMRLNVDWRLVVSLARWNYSFRQICPRRGNYVY